LFFGFRFTFHQKCSPLPRNVRLIIFTPLQQGVSLSDETRLAPFVNSYLPALHFGCSGR